MSNRFYFDIEAGGLRASDNSVLSIAWARNRKSRGSVYGYPTEGSYLGKWSENHVWEPIKDNRPLYSEKSVLRQFHRELSKLKKGTEVIGWNIGSRSVAQGERGAVGFDIPMLVSAGEKHNVPLRRAFSRLNIRDVGREAMVLANQEFLTAAKSLGMESAVPEEILEGAKAFNRKVWGIRQGLPVNVSSREVASEVAKSGIQTIGWKQELLHKQIFGKGYAAHEASADVTALMKLTRRIDTGTLGLFEDAGKLSREKFGAYLREITLSHAVNKAISTGRTEGNRFLEAASFITKQESTGLEHFSGLSSEFSSRIADRVKESTSDYQKAFNKLIAGEGLQEEKSLVTKVLTESIEHENGQISSLFKGVEVGLEKEERSLLGSIARRSESTVRKHAPLFAGLAVLTVLRPWRLFSGRDEKYNTSEGLPHGGMAAALRKQNTDFGSPVDLGKAVRRADELYKKLLPELFKDFSKDLKYSSNIVAGEGEHYLDMTLSDAKGNAVLEIARMFGSGVETESLTVAKHLRGKGIGKSIYELEPSIWREAGYSPKDAVSAEIISPITASWHEALYKSTQISTSSILSHEGYAGGEFVGRLPGHEDINALLQNVQGRHTHSPVLQEYTNSVLNSGQFPGRDDAYNTIEGLRHGGIAGILRKKNTEFGSGWDALRGVAADIVKAHSIPRLAEESAYDALLKSSLFKDALKNATEVSSLAEGAAGHVYKMEGSIGEHSFQFARKRGYITPNEVEIGNRFKDSFSPTVYGYGNLKNAESGHMDMELISGTTILKSPLEHRDTHVRAAKTLLDKMHESGVYHGDAWVNNFMVTDKGQVAAIDFGFSDYLSKQPVRTMEGGMLGPVSNVGEAQKAWDFQRLYEDAARAPGERFQAKSASGLSDIPSDLPSDVRAQMAEAIKAENNVAPIELSVEDEIGNIQTGIDLQIGENVGYLQKGTLNAKVAEAKAKVDAKLGQIPRSDATSAENSKVVSFLESLGVWQDNIDSRVLAKNANGSPIGSHFVAENPKRPSFASPKKLAEDDWADRLKGLKSEIKSDVSPKAVGGLEEEEFTGGRGVLNRRKPLLGPKAALKANRPANPVSAANEAHNKIEGLTEKGMASSRRKKNTDFGSGYKGMPTSLVGVNLPGEITSFRRDTWDNPSERKSFIQDIQQKQTKEQATLGEFEESDFTARDLATIEGINARQKDLRYVNLKQFHIDVDDADTLVLYHKNMSGRIKQMLGTGGITIRSAGIDAPETAGHAGDPLASIRMWQNQPYGEKGSSKLKQMIASSTELGLVVSTGRKTYGRYLGALTSGNKNLNIEEVRQGMVSALPFGSSSDDLINRKAIAAAEQQAFQGKKGMWALKRYQASQVVTGIIGQDITHNTLTRQDKMASNLYVGAYSTFLHDMGSQTGALSERELAQARTFGSKLRKTYKKKKQKKVQQANAHRQTSAILFKTAKDGGRGHRRHQ